MRITQRLGNQTFCRPQVKNRRRATLNHWTTFSQITLSKPLRSSMGDTNKKKKTYNTKLWTCPRRPKLSDVFSFSGRLRPTDLLITGVINFNDQVVSYVGIQK